MSDEDNENDEKKDAKAFDDIINSCNNMKIRGKTIINNSGIRKNDSLFLIQSENF